MSDEAVTAGTAGQPEVLAGFVSTTTGRTDISLVLNGDAATLTISARWMGSDPPLAIVLECRHETTGSHSGVLFLTGARPVASEQPAFSLPPSDGDIMLEYVRVPEQRAPYGGEDAWAVSRQWTDPYTLVLWLYPDAVFDDGTDLAPEEYDLPPSSFQPVVRALAWLRRPWKLGPGRE